MTHLNITQGSTVETVSALIIKKLYETALTVSEPLEGETDAAYMSGHISVPSTYRQYVEYLAGNIGLGSSGVVTSSVQNPTGRFLDLTIDVTNGYYIPFEDPEVQRVMALYFGDGTSITEPQAATAIGNNGNDWLFSNNQSIRTFPEFPLFTQINNTGEISFYNSTIESIDLSQTRIIPRFERSMLAININAPNAVGFVGNKCFLHAEYITGITSLGSVTSIPERTFSGTFRCFGKVTLPSTCTTIGIDAFDLCKTRESIDLQYITSIGEGAFYDCSNMPYVEHYNLTYVPNRCFGKNNMTTFDFSNIVTIGQTAFSGKTTAHLSGITLNIPNLTSLGKEAFFGSGIVGVQNLGTITSIPESCFDGCTALTNVTLPQTITKIGKRAFHSTAMTSITIPKNVTVLKLDAFTNSKLAAITFESPSQLETIEGGAFNGCKLVSIDIPDSVKYINSNTFFACKDLANITIGTGILLLICPFTNHIGQNAGGFTLTIKATLPPTFDYAEHGNGTVAPNAIYVPSGSVQAYQTAWPEYASIISAILV